MGIKEIMAAKKAAAEALATASVPATAPVVEAKVVEKAKEAEKAPVTVVAPEQKEEPKVLPGKPMSFAEKLAEKRRLASSSQDLAGIAPSASEGSTKEPTATAASIPVASQPTVSPLAHLAEVVQKQATFEATGLLHGKTREERAKEIIAGLEDGTSDDAAQSYVDIKLRIDELVELSEEPLVQAMSELKKALMKNPAAVSLMLDSDIGQMVIALRKMTHVATVEASKPAKEKKAPKASKVALTAEALEAAFDEM